MKTDSIFYRLFQAFPQSFFELIGNSVNEAESYQFTSQEVKQLAFRIDGLFLPITNEANKPFYIVEVQFQSDETLYYRLFSELFLYLKQYRISHPWRVVVIYPSRSIEREESRHFDDILLLDRVKRIYLDELGEQGELSLGVGVVKLIVEKPESVVEKATALVQQVRQLDDEAVIRNLINLIETIIIYQLPSKSWEEVKAMFGLDELKQTKVYQEAYEEAKLEIYQEVKLEIIPELVKAGLSLEQIAKILKLPLENVQHEAQKI
jgi:predicted transposase/invertase (TIGR01784 family)